MITPAKNVIWIVKKKREPADSKRSVNESQRQREITINKKEPIALWHGCQNVATCIVLCAGPPVVTTRQ